MKTLIILSLPTNGSATVLNTCAEKGASASQVIILISPLEITVAGTPFLSTGDGSIATISFIRLITPILVRAEPPITGIVLPSNKPVLTPAIISSLVKVPSDKYLSKNSSEVSATASVKPSFNIAISSTISAGTAISFLPPGVNSYALPEITET